MASDVDEQIGRDRERAHDAQLEQLLDDVHRIADGIGGIRELVVKITPNTPPAAAMARLRLTPGDVAAMRALLEAQYDPVMVPVLVARHWITALLKVVDDPRWVP